MKRLLAFSLFLLLSSGAYAQTSTSSADASKAQAKVVFHYGRPTPLKHCLEEMNIQIDGAPAHQIFSWHVWQTDLAPGMHVFSDDSHKDKGLTVTLAAGQTYYYEIEWRKTFGFPKCENFFNRFEEMKPKEIQKVSAMLGKPGVDETTASRASAPEVARAAGQKLLVESVPERADIEVDGNFMGNTPSAIELPSGEHTVVVSKSGYKPWQRKIKLAGGDVKLSTELERAAAQ